MSSIKEGARRAALKSIGSIQVFLGCISLFGNIAAISTVGNYDVTYSGIWSGVLYIAVGAIAIHCARFDVERPSRDCLLAGICLNCIQILACTAYVFVLLVLASIWTRLECSNPEYLSSCMTVASIIIVILNLLCTIGFSIRAAVIMVKIKKANASITDSIENAVDSAGSATTSGYIAVPLVQKS